MGGGGGEVEAGGLRERGGGGRGGGKCANRLDTVIWYTDIHNVENVENNSPSMPWF